MIAPDLIGVDWGGTHVRAFALDGRGDVIARRAVADGALRLAPEGYPVALDALVRDWRSGGAPVLVCGMAGAREGWVEAPYVDAPASLADLAERLTEAAPGVFIVPGAAMRADGRLMDSMRGEETQVFGAGGDCDFTAVCPGTHSKWARVESGRITGFRTLMTGELYAVLKDHSLLGRGMADGPFDRAAFDAGVEKGLSGRALSGDLFSVRAGFVGGWLEAGAADYLSGLLIGAEIAGAADLHTPSLRLIGAPELARRYDRAFDLAGLGPVVHIDAEAAVARGLINIWTAARS